jgi:hypothetical protein
MARHRVIRCERCRKAVPTRTNRIRCHECRQLCCRECMPDRTFCRTCWPDQPITTRNRPNPTWHNTKIFHQGLVVYGAIAVGIKLRDGGYALVPRRRHFTVPSYRNRRGKRCGRSGTAVDEAYHGPNYGEEA